MKRLYLFLLVFITCYQTAIAQGGLQIIYPIQSCSQCFEGINAALQTPVNRTGRPSEIYVNTLQGCVNADENRDCLLSKRDQQFENRLIKAE
jgi:hypothetical protein